jgi:LPXTG-site transpeptidase (sortase) family protein
VYYGFHDVIRINGTYYAWGEANSGETLLLRSATGANDWEAFDRIGGNQIGDGPLLTPGPGVSPSPTGNFFDLGDGRGFGKLYLAGDDSGIYLAVNTTALPSQAPATFEANFIDPNNWTWNNDTVGRLTPAHALLYETAIHDYREAWLVPQSDPTSPWTIVYTARFSGDLALGYASVTPPGVIQAVPDSTDEKVKASPPVLPVTGFVPGMVTELAEQTGQYVFSNYTDLSLVIPNLGLEAQIVGVPEIDRTWEVEWLGNQVGYLHGTAFPTWPGNTVLTGHVYNADGNPGIFSNLRNLSYGQQVLIYAWGQNYIYEVRENNLIQVNDLSVFEHQEYDWLTLLTCECFDEELGEYAYRRMIKAVLVKVISEK